MLLAVIGFLMIVAPVPFRLYATLRLMNGFHVDDYLRDPVARRLWIANFSLALLMPIGIVLLGIASGIWWVTMWTSIPAALIAWRIAWKMYMRLSGNYRDYMRKMQWTGPAPR